jgi:hypothetical protein
MPQHRLDEAAAQLRPMLDAEDATQGMHIQCRRGAIVLSRESSAEPPEQPELDPRFRLTPLGMDQFGLSLHRLDRWERLPFEGRLADLVEVMNTALAHWAVEF